MKFRAKLRKLGHSWGVIIPKIFLTGYNIGEEIELDVITKELKVITNKEKEVITEQEVITPRLKFNSNSCDMHKGSMKGTCGCE